MTIELDQELRNAVVDLLSSRDSANRLNGDGAPETFPDQTWRAAAGSGWFRILVDEEQDGLGLGLTELAALFKGIGTSLLRGPVLDTAVALPLLLPHFHSSWSERVGRALDGHTVGVVAGALGTPAAATDGFIAESGIVTGHATLVAFAACADFFVVEATTKSGQILIAVPADHAEVRPLGSVDPSIDYGSVQLDDVAYADNDVIADGETAAELIAAIRDTQRLMIAAEMAGTTAVLVRMATDYAKLRHQFGRPIGGFQAIRHMLAVIATRASALDNLADAMVSDVSNDPAQLASCAAIAKAYAAETSRFIAEETLQIHGGIGFTTELTMHLFYRRALSIHSLLGDPDELLGEIGEREIAAVSLPAVTDTQKEVAQ